MPFEALRVEKTREVFRCVGVEPRFECAAGDVNNPFVGALLDRDLRVGKESRQLDQQPARHDDRALTLDPGFQRRAQRELHVGGCQRQTAAFGVEEDPAKDLHSRARRDAA